MAKQKSNVNRLRLRRTELGLTQAEVAERAGVSRTAVTAMEADRLVPSVAAAIAVAGVLGQTVEELFGDRASSELSGVWAWNPQDSAGCWRAEVAGRIVSYPAHAAPVISLPPDNLGEAALPGDTLVMACCDPAAGLLASHYAARTGGRLLVIPRSSRQALQMLQAGLVHIAGLHLATPVAPERNAEIVRETLGPGYEMVRLAQWQEGVAVTPTAKLKTASAAAKARLTWIGREPGSGARQCLDQLLGERAAPRRVARHHRGVAEAIQSGWADAGVCLQLVSQEAGLDFLPVQEEAYDACYPAALANDRRLKAFLRVIRSSAYRKLIGGLPGYDASETGNVWKV
jgi:putative molybdopterin biosynthesis protein